MHKYIIDERKVTSFVVLELSREWMTQRSDADVVASSTFSDSAFTLAWAQIWPSLRMLGSLSSKRTQASALCKDSTSAPRKLPLLSWRRRRPSSAKPACSSKCKEPRQRDSAVGRNREYDRIKYWPRKVCFVLDYAPEAITVSSFSSCWHNSIFRLSFSSDMTWMDVGPPAPISCANANFASVM